MEPAAEATVHDRMRHTAAFALLALAPLAALADAKLIPLPASLTEHRTEGFTLHPDTVLVATGAAEAEAKTLAEALRAVTGYALPVKTAGQGAITLTLDPSRRAELGDEGYTLVTGSAGATLTAAAPAGLYYAGQTLRQLLPPETAGTTLVSGKSWAAPAVTIADKPRFAWRGFMLDESRQFFGVDYVKRLIDTMAAHKLNRFHWHLTDDEGWRVEIKSLPKLTGIGAWRGSETALPNPRKETEKRYGGFYTQEQIRDIVAYAKARHVEIMPEIDLPGHALALVTAYPETLPTKVGGGVSAQGFTANAISPVRAESLAIVDKIYDEITALFPFEYIHIGGDEVNHAMWADCPEIKAFMAEKKLRNLHEVQVLFTKRLELKLAAKNKKLFGWNEVLDDRLDKGTGIMSWIGTGPGYQAARKGFPVVMAPGPHAYFDMGYDASARGEPPGHGWAGMVSNARVYAFDPLGDGGDLPDAAKAKILGVHGALWTEFVMPWKGEHIELKTRAEHADYKIWPRLAALAEVGWTPQARRTYADFASRLDADHYKRLAAAGIRYRVPTPDAVTLKAGRVHILGPFPGADIRYTLDGTTPTATSARYEQPIALDGRDAARVRVRTFLDGRGGTLIAGAKPEPIGTWKEKELKPAATEHRFDATGNLTTDGIWRAVFRRTGGDKPFRLEKASLLIDGTAIATSNLTNTGDRAVARFLVPAVPAGAKVAIVATLAAPEGDKVRGEVALVKSEKLEPAVTVTSPLAAHAGNTVDKAGDWDDDTLFWIASHPKPGVLATWTFAQPVAATHVTAPSGERNGTRDQIVGGALEISEDGVTFRKVADFTYGAAEATLPAGTTLRALRVTATAPQSTWVMLRDPVLR